MLLTACRYDPTVTEANDAAPPPPLHELETKVMAQIWDRERVTVRDVLTAVNASADRQLAYTTIMTIMDRLHRKGILDCGRDGRTNVYRSRYGREEYLDARARAEVAAVVDEFGDTALVHFTRQIESLDPERREQLRRMARRG